MKNSAHSCLLQAADLFIKALDAYALEANPSFYAYIQYNLGNVYLLLSESEDTYIKKSKAAYEEALEVWIPEIHPLNYARVHRSMGDVYNKMYRMDENEDNLKFALAEYNEALKFFTIKTYPLDYAKTNTELGNTYLMLAQEEKDGKWTEDCERHIGRPWRFLIQLIILYITSIWLESFMRQKMLKSCTDNGKIIMCNYFCRSYMYKRNISFDIVKLSLLYKLWLYLLLTFPHF